jgi:hypothetical protein
MPCQLLSLQGPKRFFMILNEGAKQIVSSVHRMVIQPCSRATTNMKRKHWWMREASKLPYNMHNWTFLFRTLLLTLSLSVFLLSTEELKPSLAAVDLEDWRDLVLWKSCSSGPNLHTFEHRKRFTYELRRPDRHSLLDRTRSGIVARCCTFWAPTRACPCIVASPIAHLTQTPRGSARHFTVGQPSHLEGHRLLHFSLNVLLSKCT